jgi:hypothetical protein
MKAKFEIMQHYNKVGGSRVHWELEEQMQKIYTDLKRLEPIKEIEDKKQSLDVMFIMDCTGSMGSWIQTCKTEIESIINNIVSQFNMSSIRISVVAYRDYNYDGSLTSN